MNHEVLIREETMDLLMNIVGDTGKNEDADEVINRIAKLYLKRKERYSEYISIECELCKTIFPDTRGYTYDCYDNDILVLCPGCREKREDLQ